MQTLDHMTRLLREGLVSVGSVKVADALAKKAEAQGYRCHVDQPLKLMNGHEGSTFTTLPAVELCQGAHCHGRY